MSYSTNDLKMDALFLLQWVGGPILFVIFLGASVGLLLPWAAGFYLLDQYRQQLEKERSRE